MTLSINVKISWRFRCIPSPVTAFKDQLLNIDCDSSQFKELLPHLPFSMWVNWEQNCSVVMKSRYSPSVWVTTTPYFYHTSEECTRQGKERKDAKLVAYGAPKTWQSHSTSSRHFIGCWTILGSLIVSDKLCTVGCCHALVNPAPLPFCHSRRCSHYTNTMLRVMQIAVSDTPKQQQYCYEEASELRGKARAVNPEDETHPSVLDRCTTDLFVQDRCMTFE